MTKRGMESLRARIEEAEAELLTLKGSAPEYAKVGALQELVVKHVRRIQELEDELARLRPRLTVLEARGEAFQKERAENARLREMLRQMLRQRDQGDVISHHLLAALRPFVKQCGKVIVKNPQEGYAIIIYGQDIYDARAAVSEVEGEK